METLIISLVESACIGNPWIFFWFVVVRRDKSFLSEELTSEKFGCYSPYVYRGTRSVVGVVRSVMGAVAVSCWGGAGER